MPDETASDRLHRYVYEVLIPWAESFSEEPRERPTLRLVPAGDAALLTSTETHGGRRRSTLTLVRGGRDDA